MTNYNISFEKCLEFDEFKNCTQCDELNDYFLGKNNNSCCLRDQFLIINDDGDYECVDEISIPVECAKYD